MAKRFALLRILLPAAVFAAAFLDFSTAAASVTGEPRTIGNLLFIGGRGFDPLNSGYKKSVKVSAGGGGYHIVQLAASANDEIIRSLAANGLEVLQYIPENAFLVYASQNAINKAASSNPSIRWSGPFLPEYKVSAALRDRIAAALGWPVKRDSVSPLALTGKQRAVFDIAVFRREELSTSAEAIRNATNGKVIAEVELPGNFFNLVRVEMPLAAIDAAADLPAVFAIESWSPPIREDERAAMIVAGNYFGPATIAPPGYNPLAQFGVDGSGVTVAVEDDGVGIPGDGGFYITAANAVNGPLRGATAGASGHGHLNATIIAGDTPFSLLDADGYNYALGIAPKAHIVNIPLLRSGYSGTEAQSYSDTVATAGPNGVRASISNNSWGNGINANTYDTYAAAFDGFVRDASIGGGIDPLTIIFSAGNEGTSGLTRPKVAKNVISVAASENLRPTMPNSGGSTGIADNLEEIPDFSSRGPAADGRIKPDVTAPGDAITGGRSGPSPLFGNIDLYHRVSSGTSHAAPQVAGAAALFTQFWKNNNSGQNPSPSLVKAAIINSAVEMTGAGATQSAPNGGEGWGRINLKYLLDPNSTFRFIDDKDPATYFADTGERKVFTGRIADSSKPTKITVAWTDPPAAGEPALVNNLDLVVYIGAAQYRGNVFSSGFSVTGGSPDSINNVEGIRLPAGTPSGTPVIITVTATAINGDGVLGNADAFDQSFSIAAYNVTDSAEPFIEDSAAAIAAESANPPNGAPDPGETVTLSLTLANNGLAPASNVVATLAAMPHVTPITATQAFGTLVNGGPGQLRPFTFRVSSLAACGQFITLKWDLTESGTPIGSISKTFRLGTTNVGPQQTFSNTAAITIPASGSGSSSGSPASPYPSAINVTGLSQTAYSVTVRLNSLRHTFPADIDILLVNPAGRKFILMSDVVGGEDFTGQTYTFSDAATALLPSSGTPPASGTFRPTNYGATDSFPAPAPSPPFLSPASAGSATLTEAFAGTDGGNPNGTWQLFVSDDATGDIGAIDGGWTLTITPLNSVCSLAPTAAGVTVSGRVVDSAWRGIGRAIVTISDGDAPPRSALSNSFGFFTFENVPAGRLYIVTAAARGFSFEGVAAEISDSATFVVLTGESTRALGR